MKRTTVISIFALLGVGAAWAQPFDLSWHTIDGGGGMFSTGGGFELGGTIGQPDAGPVMSGGGFELRGGFWPGVQPSECPGDVNGDGRVDLTDLAILLAAFGHNAGGDLDGDGDTDLADLAILLANYGSVCP